MDNSPGTKIIGILVVIVLVIVGVGYYLYLNSQQTGSPPPAEVGLPGPGPDTLPTAPATVAVVPQLLSAEYIGVPAWDPQRRLYVNTMRVSFSTTTGPLFLKETNNWKNKNGMGVAIREVDISQWASEGSVVRERQWLYQGEYTLTMTIRSADGESNSITLPTLIVQ